jgi:hypothetical protein
MDFALQGGLSPVENSDELPTAGPTLRMNSLLSSSAGGGILFSLSGE